MARRYRYAIIKKKETKKGSCQWDWQLLPCFCLGQRLALPMYSKAVYGFIVGGICLFATLLSVYGFLMGVASFSEENCNHRTSIVGTILNGVFLVGWLLFF